jgi:hypothetical protein
MFVGYQNMGYPQSTIKKNKTLRKPRQKLCPPRRDKPKRRTKRLDHVSTRTRLARRDASINEKSLTRTTLGRAGRSIALTNSETKVKAFNATANHFLPSWLQQQPAWRQYLCQISLFTTHPGMGGENLSLYAPYRALFHLEVEYDEYYTPKFLGLSLIHSSSTHLDPASTNRRSNKKARLACHRT